MCIKFCLSLGNRSHVGIKEFKDINWLPVNARFEQNVTTNIFKQQNKLAPKYIDGMFTYAKSKSGHLLINLYFPTVTK